jgi:uncharacterized protein YndB with AHSA1/START domain
MSGWSDEAEIKKSVEVSAPSLRVFRALIDEKELVRWMPNEAKMEAKVGGSLRFRFHWAARNIDTEVTGKVVELVPNRLVSYTWMAAMRSDRTPARKEDSPASLVAWSLQELPSGGTRVTLTQTGLDERYRQDGESGWEHFLGQLATYCRGR